MFTGTEKIYVIRNESDGRLGIGAQYGNETGNPDEFLKRCHDRHRHGDSGIRDLGVP